MDPKRKRIYLIIIGVCLAASAAVFLIGRFGGAGGGAGPAPEPNVANHNVPAIVTGDAALGFSAPAVFPANPNFDFSVLDSSSFKQLKTYNPVLNEPGELGRDDPFKNY